MLYIHIPFCDSKCNYCNFNSYTNLHYLQNRYIDVLLHQLDFEIERFQIEKFQSIYIGGGTPSTLSIKNIEKLFSKLSKYITPETEITIEANPNSANRDWLSAIYQLGINRISLGVQSFNDKKLKFLGRNHSKNQAIRAVENSYSVGFKNINIDLIYNTSIDNLELIQTDIDTLFSLPISHTSLYSLTIEEETPFANMKRVQREDIELTKYIIQRVDSKFPQYEISNFGTPSKHNLGYWQGKNYIGIGSGAVGFLKNQRFYPNRDVEKYIANPLDIEIERLTESDLKLEKLFLGFRSMVGVAKEILNRCEIEKADILVEHGKLRFENGSYFNSDYLIADEVALFVSDVIECK